MRQNLGVRRLHFSNVNSDDDDDARIILQDKGVACSRLISIQVVDRDVGALTLGG